jgi:hypothetical protein
MSSECACPRFARKRATGAGLRRRSTCGAPSKDIPHLPAWISNCARETICNRDSGPRSAASPCTLGQRVTTHRADVYSPRALAAHRAAAVTDLPGRRVSDVLAGEFQSEREEETRDRAERGSVVRGSDQASVEPERTSLARRPPQSTSDAETAVKTIARL